MNRPVHVINVEIKDNHEEALIAGRALLDLCTAVSTFTVPLQDSADAESVQIERSPDVDADLAGILARQQESHPHALLHSIMYY